MRRVALFVMFAALALSLAPAHRSTCCVALADGSAHSCCSPNHDAVRPVCCMPVIAIALPGRNQGPIARASTAYGPLLAAEAAPETIRRATAAFSLLLPLGSPPQIVLRI